MTDCKEGVPLISVVVPIYNVEAYLKNCIESLLEQDYENYEIILVDDCSTDHGLEIAKEYLRKVPEKCKLVQRKENGGLSAARNSGIKVAIGEWITFIDSDDWVANDYLSSLYNVAYQDDADVVMGNIYYAYSRSNVRASTAFGNLKNGADNKEIIAICKSYACGRLFKTKLFLESQIYFPEDIKRSEDIGTIIPILTRARHISLVEKPLYFYFQRSTSISNSNINVDLSFYPQTLQRMYDLSKSGFESELEFRSVHEMLYGMVLLMLESNKPVTEFRNHVDRFNQNFPNWRKNQYISWLPKEKYIFILLSGKKCYLALKMLVGIRRFIKRASAVKNGFRTKSELSTK